MAILCTQLYDKKDPKLSTQCNNKQAKRLKSRERRAKVDRLDGQ